MTRACAHSLHAVRLRLSSSALSVHKTLGRQLECPRYQHRQSMQNAYPTACPRPHSWLPTHQQHEASVGPLGLRLPDHHPQQISRDRHNAPQQSSPALVIGAKAQLLHTCGLTPRPTWSVVATHMTAPAHPKQRHQAQQQSMALQWQL
jgi:hypothetical protein